MFPLRDTKSSGRFPVQTLILILINLYAFYLEFTSPNSDLFIQHYGLIPGLINWSQPATLIPLITAQFLHGGVFHILSNMWFLWIFGDNVEDAFGPWFLPFYLIGGIVANLTQYVMSPHALLPVVGASGAVAAVLGAYLILYPRNTIHSLIFLFIFITVIDVPAIIILGYWFLTQLFNGYFTVGATAATGGVAYFAHIGGFVYGLFMATLWGGRYALRRAANNQP